jgi:hypothetical protein
MKKYELTSETLRYAGHTLHRIKALRDFGVFKAGELGGWIESEENLSQAGNAWVFDNAKVFGGARVIDYAEVYSNALVCDNAMACGFAKIFDNAEVFGKAVISGNAKVCDDADYIVFKNFWSSGRYFTWTRSNNKWRVGCFYGTGEELIKKAYADSEKSGREYERVVRYVESILADEQKKSN